MSWIKTAAKLTALGAGLIATGALAGTIVVRASGPSAAMYPPGKAITAATLNLKAGDSLVLLDAKGTRTISGPGIRPVAGGSAAVAPSALGALIRSSGARQVRTGAVRGTGTTAARTPNLWYVDPAQSGTMCVSGTPTLWRADMTAPMTLTATRLSDGKSVPVAFAAGQSVQRLPAEIAADGRWRFSGGGKTSEVTLKAVTPASDAPDAVASALIAQGCQRQLDRLVEVAGASPAS